MYLSPILWAPEHIIGRLSGPIMTLIQLSPMHSMIGGYTELLQNDAFPTPYMWILRCGVGAGGCGDRFLVLHLEGA
jgi:teichoic acid transport system permease protein